MSFACCNVLGVLDVFVECAGIEGTSRGGIRVCVSGGLNLPCNDVELILCFLFLGGAVECCIDGLDCGGGDHSEKIGCGGSEGACIWRDEG